MSNSELKLVSVVIPTYNQVSFIDETINSVIKQSYSNLEIIVADDCSTDGTKERLEYYTQKDRRIKLLLSEKNLGIPANFNRAFDQCTGEFIAFLGGDDIMFSNKIEEQVNYLQEHRDCVLVQSDMELVGKTSIKKLSDNGAIPINPLDWALRIDWSLEGNYSGVIPSSCLARSDYYLAARYSDELYLKHELLFTLDCYCNKPEGKWGVINKVLGRYRLHESNFSQSNKANKSILMESFKLSALVKKRCPNLIDRAREFEFYTSYTAKLFDKSSNSKEKQLVDKLFKERANLVQRYFLEMGKVLRKFGLLGVYTRLNKYLGIFK